MAESVTARTGSEKKQAQENKYFDSCRCFFFRETVVDQPRLTGWSQVLLQRLTAGPGEGSGTKANREKAGDDFTVKNLGGKKHSVAWRTKTMMRKMSESSRGVYYVGV